MGYLIPFNRIVRTCDILGKGFTNQAAGIFLGYAYLKNDCRDIFIPDFFYVGREIREISDLARVVREKFSRDIHLIIEARKCSEEIQRGVVRIATLGEIVLFSQQEIEILKGFLYED